MTDKDLIQSRRIQVFEDWEAGNYETIGELCQRHGFSRQWFYKWRERWEKHGPEGMRSRKPGPDSAHNAIEPETVGQIIEHVKHHPAHGCDWIALELENDVHPSTVQRYLNEWELGTAKQRLEFHRLTHGEVMTAEDFSAWETDRRKSKTRHLEVRYPGELVGMDLFYIGTIKGIGRIYQFTAIDCYSSFGFAGIYTEKTADNAIGFVRNHVLPYFEKTPLQRVLTDNGKEFTTHWENGSHRFTEALKDLGIRQTTTKVKHPWTNGHAERFQQTVLNEFYQKVFQETHYSTVEQLERDLKEYLREYNFERPHQGRRTEGRSPAWLFYEPSKQPALPAEVA